MALQDHHHVTVRKLDAQKYKKLSYDISSLYPILELTERSKVKTILYYTFTSFDRFKFYDKGVIQNL